MDAALLETPVAGAPSFADSADPVRSALEHYRTVAAYQATVKSSGGAHVEIMRYYFRQPGYVRMEFVSPFNGAVLIYDPVSRQAHLWPFGHRNFPSLTLSPENRLIRSRTGQRVDRSDVGALYRNVQALQERGKTRVGAIAQLGGRETQQLTVEGKGGSTVERVHRYQLWLDRATGFPVRVISHDAAGSLIEEVEMEGLQINPGFPDGFFGQ